MTHQFDKSKLPSRHVSVGPERAPHRSYYYAMGIAEEDIAKPFVALASAGNDSAPCNTTLDAQADAARAGVIQGGGMPRRFNTITVTDGIAMGHQGMKSSLVSREVIADSVELSVRGHCYDALVGFAGCDKSLPGMMMAMLRLNVPSIFVYGGSILPGRYQDRDVTVVDVFEAVGQHAAGNCPIKDLTDLEKVACPGHGACGGQYTANTMACVGEAIGLSLPNSNMVPAPYTTREQIAVAAGAQVMELIAANIRPRDICTREAFINAARIVAATGGSTNGALHLPAMANEAGIDFDLFDVAEIFKSTPYIADLKPGGKYVAKDMYEAGGVYMLMKTMLANGLLYGDCLTVTGRSIGENIAGRQSRDREVIRPFAEPLKEKAGFLAFSGNLFDFAIMKTSVISEEFRARYLSHPGKEGVFEGRAIVFDGSDDYHHRINDPALEIDENCILVIRGAGPIGWPGSAEVVNMQPPDALIQRGIAWLPTLGDGRQSGTSDSPSILNASPESAVGGGLAWLHTGDVIRIDLNTGRCDVLVDEAEIARRKGGPAPAFPSSNTPWEELYREKTGQLEDGAVLEMAVKYRGIAAKTPRHNH